MLLIIIFIDNIKQAKENETISIRTIESLKRAIHGLNDNFVTIRISDREYIIDRIINVRDYTDPPSNHFTLECRDGGQGNIKR